MNRIALILAAALATACDSLPDDQTDDFTTTTASTTAATTTDEDSGTTDPNETDASTGDVEVVVPPPTPNGCPGEPCEVDTDCAGNPDAPSIIPRCAAGVCAWQCVPPNLEGVCGPGSECLIDEVGTGSGLCSGTPIC